MSDPLANTIDSAEAAKLLRLTDRRVRQLCQEGQLTAIRPGSKQGWIRIPKAEVYARVGITLNVVQPTPVDPNEIRRIIANRTRTA